MQWDSGTQIYNPRGEAGSLISLDSEDWGSYDFRINRPTGRFSIDSRPVRNIPGNKGIFPPLV